MRPATGTRELAAIFAGGFIGAIARVALAEGLAADPAQWPWATFVANIAGALVLGYVAERVRDRRRLLFLAHRLLRRADDVLGAAARAAADARRRALRARRGLRGRERRRRARGGHARDEGGARMSAALWLAVGVLGGLGAIARFLVDGAVSRRVARRVSVRDVRRQPQRRVRARAARGRGAGRDALRRHRRRAARRVHDVQHVDARDERLAREAAIARSRWRTSSPASRSGSRRSGSGERSASRSELATLRRALREQFDEHQRTSVERLVTRDLDESSGKGRPLSDRARQSQRSVEAYLKGGVRPRWMERAVDIDGGIARERRLLAGAYAELREACRRDGGDFAERWRALAHDWPFPADSSSSSTSTTSGIRSSATCR